MRITSLPIWLIEHEGPHQQVTITRPFYMGIYEVTQEQYQAVMGENPSRVTKGRTIPVGRDSMDFRVSENGHSITP